MHSVVIYKRNFISPDNDMVHTQNVENTWVRAKRKLKRQFGTSRALFHSYFDEYMWTCSVERKNYCLICLFPYVVTINLLTQLHDGN